MAAGRAGRLPRRRSGLACGCVGVARARRAGAPGRGGRGRQAGHGGERLLQAGRRADASQARLESVRGLPGAAEAHERSGLPQVCLRAPPRLLGCAPASELAPRRGRGRGARLVPARVAHAGQPRVLQRGGVGAQLQPGSGPIAVEHGARARVAAHSQRRCVGGLRGRKVAWQSQSNEWLQLQERAGSPTCKRCTGRAFQESCISLSLPVYDGTCNHSA